MKRTILGAAALAVFALIVVAGAAAATPVTSGVTSNGFETNTAGWFDSANYNADFGTITQRATGYNNPGGYADLINAADGTHFAGLTRTTCYTDFSPGNGAPVDTLSCAGPFTDWGNRYGYHWNGDYTTQVDIYLDTAYAILHPDVYPDSNGDPASTQPGDIAGLSLDANPAGTPEDVTVPGTRFDFTSAINSSTPVHLNGDPNNPLVGGFLQDFGFNVSTGTADDGCAGFVINATTNVGRAGANPNVAGSKTCIDQSGWYTFKHSFSEDATNNLDVVMQIIPQDTNTDNASWTVDNAQPIANVGCNRYGWFSEQEIWGLPIDNAKIEGGCAEASISQGQIAPTGTTCQAYDAGTAATLATVQYTLTKGDKINSVSPGVFFYYGTITGTSGQTFTIDQTSNPAAPFIPVQHGQVILYDENCNVLKWTPTTDANGDVIGTLPSTGTFIISVKYSASALKGENDPGTVIYTIDDASVTLAKKT